MTADVVKFNRITTLDIPARDVLMEAIKADLHDVIVLGYTPDGVEYIAGTSSDMRKMLWQLEQAKMFALTPDDE